MALGTDWQRVQQTWLHTLGNLTLTGYNAVYSDRPFEEKREMDRSFRHSPLELNEGMGEVERWNEPAVQARADRPAALAVNVWLAPSLSASLLDTDRPTATKRENYTIEDHPQLTAGPIRELFEALRKEVLALDPCVAEELPKLYIAYKPEANFVDVEPQAKRLRLSLNMSFHEIQDPTGLCKDVTNLGR